MIIQFDNKISYLMFLHDHDDYLLASDKSMVRTLALRDFTNHPQSMYIKIKYMTQIAVFLFAI